MEKSFDLLLVGRFKQELEHSDKMLPNKINTKLKFNLKIKRSLQQKNSKET